MRICQCQQNISSYPIPQLLVPASQGPTPSLFGDGRVFSHTTITLVKGHVNLHQTIARHQPNQLEIIGGKDFWAGHWRTQAAEYLIPLAYLVRARAKNV